MKAEDALNMAKSYVRKTAEGLGAVKGKDGKDGISPAIVENTNNTDDVYKLDITDVNGTFTTPNLKGGGGTDGTSVIDDTTSSLNTTYSSSKIESTFAKSDDVTNALEGKVDTVVGKGLSTNDYTTEEKTKLASLENYDDTTLSQRVTDIENDYAKTSEIPTKVSQLENDSNYLSSIPEEYVTETELDAKGYLTEHQDISGKVDKVEGKSLISDTEIARLASVANYDDTDIKAEIDKKADTTSIPSKVSVLENDSKYQTESDVTTTLTYYATKTYVGEQIANAEHLKREIVTVLPSDTEASDNIIYMLKVESATGNDKYQEYIKIDGTVQMVGDTSVDLTDYAKTVDIPTTVAQLTDSTDYAKTSDIPTSLPANGGNANTVNNHTVETDVPSDAVFTDTTYSAATTEKDGLMSVEDKKQVDKIGDTDISSIGDGTLADILSSLTYPNAGAHNSIYRGKNLGTSYTAEQKAQIQAGTFNDLWIGDYWVIGGITWRIAHFDYWLHCGDTEECTKHHIVIVPDTCLYSANMNDTDVTTGAYVGSKMYKENLASAKTTINNAFGAANILTHREVLANATSATTDPSFESAMSWYDSTVELMNERMVYGADVFHNIESNGRIPQNYTINKSQLALFRLDPSKICNRADWWLRGVVSSAYFALVDGIGDAGCCNASIVGGVRPAFGIC